MKHILYFYNCLAFLFKDIWLIAICLLPWTSLLLNPLFPYPPPPPSAFGLILLILPLLWMLIDQSFKHCKNCPKSNPGCRLWLMSASHAFVVMAPLAHLPCFPTQIYLEQLGIQQTSLISEARDNLTVYSVLTHSIFKWNWSMSFTSWPSVLWNYFWK